MQSGRSLSVAFGRHLRPSPYSVSWHLNNNQSRLFCDVSNTQLDSPDRQPKQRSSPKETNRHDLTPSPSARLFGRSCMITGGSSGIGLAIAERFISEGVSKVIIVGRSYPRLLDAANRLQHASRNAAVSPQNKPNTDDGVQGQLVSVSEKISVLVGDVSAIDSWSRTLEKEMESIDILVNAAGISISSLLPKTDPEDISRTLRTNLEGALLTSRAFLRASVRSRIKNRNKPDPEATKRSKCIINVSSLLSHKGGTGAVPYAASKAGILGLTRSLTVEASETLREVVIRSNVIVPGYIETPIIEDIVPAELERLKQNIPLKRFGSPQEVADAAVFLAENEYANNCVLNLDGGLSAV
ncbi:tRNA-splicing endonuclease subunit sen54 [Paecilomyces lecythidis]|uniref:tRNA-splicing endonuclease subunit sen54 n=1 Tax=Paecilomyces lecythidis TaxID=3004212 RepID=A0ABR3XHV8_9EURO